ncbi:DNA-binding transcriptional regulator, MarR family [Ruegeria halocynthiae]|uniref:DNA-binding transcriptional regulator, MarR family n=1 Tax=Ruegeria halocynthiae TaxID=985054 RepID=A0A1H3FQU0_9RHOB|nr:MarR family transcriptional regulator [Ruegeria halocynthiae]SDX93442.1 DNA-binding transcriptional regulator, MarR family [Ruegeria halocynthiae]
MYDSTNLYNFIRLVRPLYKVLENAVARELDGTGLTVTERAVLERLHDHGPLSVPRIADRLIAPRQFVQKTANALIEKGFVERRQNTAHRRSKLLVLSASGAELIETVLAREAINIASVSECLSPEEIATAMRVTEVIIEGFAEKETKDD